MAIPKERSSPTPPIERLISPFHTFAKQASAGGIVLLACAITAMIGANSPLAETYFLLWETSVEVRFGHLVNIDNPTFLLPSPSF